MTADFRILYSTQKIDFRSLDKSVEDPRYEGIRAVDRKKVGFHVSLKVTKSLWMIPLFLEILLGYFLKLVKKEYRDEWALMQHYVLIAAPFAG